MRKIKTELSELTDGRITPREADPVQLVTPYLPDKAKREMREHEDLFKQPCFVMAVQRMPGQCPNCGGIGGIYVRMCKFGPSQSPGGLAGVSTYFDGNERVKKGWYTVDKLVPYWCPECKPEMYSNGTREMTTTEIKK